MLAVIEDLGTRLFILLSSMVFFPAPPKHPKSGNGVLGDVSCHMGQVQKKSLGTARNKLQDKISLLSPIWFKI